MKVAIEMSPGEIADRASILELKISASLRAKKDTANRSFLHQSDQISAYLRKVIPIDGERRNKIIEALGRLHSTNDRLWKLEDKVRRQIANELPGAGKTALTIIKTNDVRAALKAEINAIIGSPVAEMKFHK